MTALNLRFDWFFRYKLHHIPFWFLYHYFWWSVTIGSVSDVANNVLYSAYSIKTLFYIVFQAMGVYFNLYYLMPRFLEQGKYAAYVGLLFVTIVVIAAFIASGYYFSAWVSERTFQELYGIEPERYSFHFHTNTLASTVASMTLAMSAKLTKDWLKSRRHAQELEKEKQELAREKLETELKFLKSQFNPHFLFNTINSIFVLIKKDPELASDTLAKFSDMLRYQLYECNEQEIPLAQELGYLHNYIELQRLRQDENDVELSVDADLGRTANLAIAPFLLIPFVENAFKHVSRHRDRPNRISIRLHLHDNNLHLEVANTRSEVVLAEFIRHSGIGLQNVRRRLDLTYPESHQLVIQNDPDIFKVDLTLTLRERAVTEHATQTAA